MKLVDYYYQKYGGSPVEAVRHAMVRIRGSYALAMMFRDYPEEIFVARKDSPMILGVENGESYIASDVPAILKYTRNVYYIGNLELACVKPGEITFTIWMVRRSRRSLRSLSGMQRQRRKPVLSIS